MIDHTMFSYLNVRINDRQLEDYLRRQIGSLQFDGKYARTVFGALNREFHKTAYGNWLILSNSNKRSRILIPVKY